MVVEGEIDNGSYTSVDPLEKIVVQGANSEAVLSERLFSSEAGVKILAFRLIASGDIVEFVEAPLE